MGGLLRMTVQIEDRGDGRAVVEVRGQLVVSNRQALRDAVTRAIESGARRLVLDFSHADYIDLSGLGLLVSLARALESKNGEIRIAGLNDDLRGLFELTRLDTVFTIADDREAALETF
jgi:anti-sigma B factor antagonist